MQGWGSPETALLVGMLGGKREGSTTWRGFSSTAPHWDAILRERPLVAQPGGSSAALSVAEPLRGQAVLSPSAGSPPCWSSPSQLLSLLSTQSLARILPGAGSGGSPKHQGSTSSGDQPCPGSCPPHKTCIHLVPIPAALTLSSCLHFVPDWKRK